MGLSLRQRVQRRLLGYNLADFHQGEDGLVQAGRRRKRICRSYNLDFEQVLSGRLAFFEFVDFFRGYLATGRR